MFLFFAIVSINFTDLAFEYGLCVSLALQAFDTQQERLLMRSLFEQMHLMSRVLQPPKLEPTHDCYNRLSKAWARGEEYMYSLRILVTDQAAQQLRSSSWR